MDAWGRRNTKAQTDPDALKINGSGSEQCVQNQSKYQPNGYEILKETDKSQEHNHTQNHAINENLTDSPDSSDKESQPNITELLMDIKDLSAEFWLIIASMMFFYSSFMPFVADSW